MTVYIRYIQFDHTYIKRKNFFNDFEKKLLTIQVHPAIISSNKARYTRQPFHRDGQRPRRVL